jgi:hypothetical protein
VPVDGYSGADQFTVQVKDGLNQDAQLGSGNIFKITLYKPYLDVKTILHNAPNGDLPQAQKVDYGGTVAQGAYVPIFDKNYDLTETSYVTLQPNTKTALLPIVLKAFNPAPGGWAGYYTLGLTGNVKVFRDPASKDPVGFLDTFWADQDTTLWVEGVSAGTETLGLSWSDLVHSAGDQSKMTVFTWSGPRDVPGTSRYTYAADGGMLGAGNSTWIAPYAGGDLFSNTPSDTGTDKAEVKWKVGPLVGDASYQAAPGYVWDMPVNVVHVAVSPGAPGGAFQVADSVPRDAGNALLNNQVEHNVYSKVIDGLTADGHAGVKWRAVITLTGPLGGRGVDHIRTGFIQTITTFVAEGTYKSGARLISSLQTHVPMTDDSIDDPTDEYPWYTADTDGRLTGQKGNDPGYYPASGLYLGLITSDDSPKRLIPLTAQKHMTVQDGDDVLAEIDVIEDFTLDIASVTLDPTVGDEGSKSFTRAATALWSFVAIGPVGAGPAYAWTPDPGVYIARNQWTTVTDGSRVLLPPSKTSTELPNNQYVSP